MQKKRKNMQLKQTKKELTEQTKPLAVILASSSDDLGTQETPIKAVGTVTRTIQKDSHCNVRSTETFFKSQVPSSHELPT
jgi:hypothetical protein